MIKYVQKHYINYLKTLKITKSYEHDYQTRQTIKYINVPCAFDIETTSIVQDGKKSGYMYVAMFGIGTEVFYCRDWDAVKEILHITRLFYGLDKFTRLVCYVHFLSFEFQFFRKIFGWHEVFAVDERKPIKALCTYGVEWRDSYILSALSLAKTAENLANHDVRKLSGDLDYHKTRHAATPLGMWEYKYCENDVYILLAYISEQLDDYHGNISEIPLTNTGRVRRYMRDCCFYSGKKRTYSDNKGNRYRELMRLLSLGGDSYAMLKLAFAGGFVHANGLKVGGLLENVHSMDEASAYPYAMVSEEYPMGAPEKIMARDVGGLAGKLWVAHVKLYHVQSKIFYECYLSESKCYNVKKGVVNNGRIFSADYLETVITNVDLEIIEMAYTYDIELVRGYEFYSQYLPTSLIKGILGLYAKKTELKGVAGKEQEYLKSKGMLNSVYGMAVTDIIRAMNTYDPEIGEWVVEKPDKNNYDEIIGRNNGKQSRFLYYPWGVWTTAYSRKNLWRAVVAMGEDYAYSDTDSVKFEHLEKHELYFKKYNLECKEKLKNMCAYNKIDYSLTCPKTAKGVEKPLGAWEYEGASEYFKTLGAKRYMQRQGGKYKLTCAGLAKADGMRYIEAQGGGDVRKVFAYFNNNMTIPAGHTGKQTHTYIDSPRELEVRDWTGRTAHVSVLTGIHLEEAEYTLSIARQYANFLANLKQGYIYAGRSVM